MQQETIKDKLLGIINPKEFYKGYFAEWDGDNRTLVKCPRGTTHHEQGDDSTHSFSINGDTGEFNCFGCGFHGTSVIGFVTDVKYAGNFRKALAILYNKYVGKVISPADIRGYHDRLRKSPALLRTLRVKRRWSPETVDLFKLGWDSDTKRVVIPIFTAAGFAVDIRKHDSLYVAPKGPTGKRITMLASKSSTNGFLYPLRPGINPFDVNQEDIWIVEGEPDAITARQEGLNAVTVTGGVSQLLKMGDEILRYFQKRNVIICLDNDVAGQTVAKKLAERFVSVDLASLKVMVVPDGKDVTDFIVKHGGSGDVLKQIAKLEEYVIKPQRKNTTLLALGKTSEAKYVGSKVITDVIINGKHRAPHVIPQKIELSCNTIDKCDRCPCNNAVGTAEHYVSPEDEDILEWVKAEPRTKIRRDLGIPAKCPISAKVLSYQNLEQVSLIPALSLSAGSDRDQFCQRVGYFAGHGIEANRSYRIEASPTKLSNNESALVIQKAESSADSLEDFTLSTDEVTRLKELMVGTPGEILKDVASMLSSNVTKIYDRTALHIAVDLTFHSPREFNFSGVALPKGSMELLLFGDTRCGKGQVAEGIAKFYDLGAVISGESCSFMGMFGGASKVGDSFQLVWGALPINHGRLVIIDEFSGLSGNELGKLSRIRSEGIAELNKGGIAAKTRANTRLIWIANPRGGKQVAAFGSGAQAVMDLIKAAEDVARFDLAIVVQKDEVDPAVINRTHQPIQSKFAFQDLRKILLWVWSRNRDHVIFTRQATEYILRVSNQLAKRYTSTIPLIQGENVRFKIAKIAAAVAGRCFSTEDGKFLKVEEAHARAAVAFLVACYDKPSMGYKQISTIEQRTVQLTDVTALDRWFGQFDATRRGLIIDAMLEADTLSVRDVEDATDHDTNRCRKHLGLLVRCHALKLGKRGEYEKRPAFIRYLKQHR